MHPLTSCSTPFQAGLSAVGQLDVAAGIWRGKLAATPPIRELPCTEVVGDLW